MEVCKTQTSESLRPGVVYVGHIPHGFFEQEMTNYFSQFGSVNRLRLVRSRKSGRSRGFAFVEFACDEVAKIVADTMNNYLMYDKLLKCRYIAPGSVHRGMLVRQRRKKVFPESARIKSAQKQHNKGRSAVQFLRCVKKARARERKKMTKLRTLGIDYQHPGSNIAAPTHTHFTTE